jgi:hypothetical protein
MAKAPTKLMTAEELFELRHPDRRAELVRRRVVRMSLPNVRHAVISMKIGARLLAFVEAHGLSYVCAETGCITARHRPKALGVAGAGGSCPAGASQKVHASLPTRCAGRRRRRARRERRAARAGRSPAARRAGRCGRAASRRCGRGSARSPARGRCKRGAGRPGGRRDSVGCRFLVSNPRCRSGV